MRIRFPATAAVLGASLSLLVLSGCSKLKSALGKGEDGGTSASAPAAEPGGGTEKGKSASGPSILNGFEGQIDVRVQSGSRPASNLAVLAKDGKLRVDLPPEIVGPATGKVAGILDPPSKKAYALLDKQKQAIVVDLDKAGEQLKAMSKAGPGMGTSAAPTKPPPKVTKTGKTDTVAGYTCEIWEIADASSKASACIADEGGSFFKIPLIGAPADYAWLAELADGKHFPLRFIGYGKDGTEEGRAEVTKIEKKPVPAASFEIPAGYKTVPLEQMLQGMMPPGMGKR